MAGASQYWVSAIALSASTAAAAAPVNGLALGSGPRYSSDLFFYRGLVTEPGECRSFHVWQPSATGASRTRTYTLRRNGVDTSLAVSFGPTDSGLKSITLTETFAADDDVDISITVTGSGSLNINIVSIATEFQPDVANYYCYPNGTASQIILGVNDPPQYVPLLATGGDSSVFTTDVKGVRSISPIAGTITRMSVQRLPIIGTNLNGGTCVIVIEKNGADAATMNYVSTPTDNGGIQSISPNVSVARGDELSFYYKSASGLFPDANCHFGVTFVPTTTDEFVLTGSTEVDGSSTATRHEVYNGAGVGVGSGVPTATETSAVLRFPGNVTLLRAYSSIDTAPGAGTSWTFTSRNELADGNITFAIADSATTGNDTAHTDALAASDRVDWKIVPAGTPTGWGTASWGVAAKVTSAPSGGGGGGGLRQLMDPFSRNYLDRVNREVIADRRPERIRP